MNNIRKSFMVMMLLIVSMFIITVQAEEISINTSSLIEPTGFGDIDMKFDKETGEMFIGFLEIPTPLTSLNDGAKIVKKIVLSGTAYDFDIDTVLVDNGFSTNYWFNFFNGIDVKYRAYITLDLGHLNPGYVAGNISLQELTVTTGSTEHSYLAYSDRPVIVSTHPYNVYRTRIDENFELPEIKGYTSLGIEIEDSIEVVGLVDFDLETVGDYTIRYKLTHDGDEAHDLVYTIHVLASTNITEEVGIGVDVDGDGVSDVLVNEDGEVINTLYEEVEETASSGVFDADMSVFERWNAFTVWFDEFTDFSTMPDRSVNFLIGDYIIVSSIVIFILFMIIFRRITIVTFLLTLLYGAFLILGYSTENLIIVFSIFASLFLLTSSAGRLGKSVLKRRTSS